MFGAFRRIFRSRPVAIGFLIALLVLSGVPAASHEQTKFDADDSDGPLDVAATRLRHVRLTEASLHPPRERKIVEIRLRISTYEQWDSELLQGPHNFVAFEFNFDNDSNIERCIVITHGEHEPRAELRRNCDYLNDEMIRVLSAHRPNKNGMITAIARHHLKKGIRDFRWRAVTSYEDDESAACPTPEPHGDGGYGSCRDFTEWKRHRF